MDKEEWEGGVLTVLVKDRRWRRLSTIFLGRTPRLEHDIVPNTANRTILQSVGGGYKSGTVS